jgi:hypothetical protein
MFSVEHLVTRTRSHTSCKGVEISNTVESSRRVALSRGDAEKDEFTANRELWWVNTKADIDEPTIR